nr:MAG TPA: hypothetical protein [Caudoviricetes sp.]
MDSVVLDAVIDNNVKQICYSMQQICYTNMSAMCNA